MEYLLAVTFFVVLSLYRFLDIPLRQPWELYFTRVLGAFGWYFLALFLTPFFLRLKDLGASRSRSRQETWREFRNDYFTLPRLLRDLRLVHALGLVFVLFIELKHLIPFLAWRYFDDLLFDFELSLFGEGLLTKPLQTLFGVTNAPWWSCVYTLFFPYMGILLGVFVLQRDGLLASRFTLGFAWVWFLGILLVYLVPTLGPCFLKPELYRELPATPTSELIDQLWKGKLFVEANPRNSAGIYLISGFPSLHMAVVSYGTLMFGRVGRFAFWISFLFLILTTLSTLYFAWHYLIDDLGGVLLGYLVWFSLFSSSVEGKPKKIMFFDRKKKAEIL